ncbi:hypothetical protein [Leptolyngbya sp. PCC 6406]|uniref:hypothetical protein n=1 Tax=Leptolyngbya sp. PCC 6406 TaxID=1173264 RepID=UPI0002ACA1C1|nr:hypothetical protein [Leptolyngbya sp. PCC 6406]
MAASEFQSIPAYQKLKTLRPLLLKLHKALLNVERDHYERIHGPITSKGEFFQLVIGDEWFSWLRPMSQFIVQMDEVLWSKEPISPNQIHTLLSEARDLVPPAAEQSEAAIRYFQALQRDIDVAEIHGEVSTLLRASDPKLES